MKVMNHTEYQKRVKTLPDITLEFVINDCKEAVEANPDSDNVGYYQDEIHYCQAELKRRRDMKRPSGKYTERQLNVVIGLIETAPIGLNIRKTIINAVEDIKKDIFK